MERRISKKIKLGNKYIGGDSPVSVQSMCNTDSHDFAATRKQVRELVAAGCEIVRIAVPDKDCVGIFDYIKSDGIDIPLVADIHFDYKLAIESCCSGADKIRINPGNIGSDDRIKAVCDCCREHNVPIRIGVNSGSLDKVYLNKYNGVCAKGLSESLLNSISVLEKFDFNDIVLAIKSSDVSMMIEANRMIADKCDYPLHIGVTEAGSMRMGILKSALGIGSLLSSGIGDTLRVSLTSNPLNEVEIGIKILEELGLREKNSIEVVSCPTCGRTRIDLIKLVEDFENRMSKEILNKNHIKVAIMGCAVNGPGEAREADIGLAGGNNEAIIFKKGEIVKKVPARSAIDELIKEINKL